MRKTLTKRVERNKKAKNKSWSSVLEKEKGWPLKSNQKHTRIRITKLIKVTTFHQDLSKWRLPPWFFHAHFRFCYDCLFFVLNSFDVRFCWSFINEITFFSCYFYVLLITLWFKLSNITYGIGSDNRFLCDYLFMFYVS